MPDLWEVELQCPQCGAPVTLDEADRILACAFCRVRLLLIYPGYPHYYLEPYQQNQKPVQDIIFVPYWRFKGLAYACLQPHREDRLVDITSLAAEIPFLPPFLGLQARAFKLRLYSSQKKEIFLHPHFPFEAFLKQITEENETSQEPEEMNSLFRETVVGETISLVYAPFYIKEGFVFDGLGSRQLGKANEYDFEKFSVTDQGGDWSIEFIPALCPYCGADLQGEKDTQILLCRNCDRVWEFFQGGLKKIDFGVLKALNQKPLYYIPFWRIRAKIDGWPQRTYSLLPRSALYTGGEEKGETFFWLPAFKLSPSGFLTVSRAVSFRQPLEYQLLEKIPKGQYYPVTLAWEQAAKALNAVVADLLKTHLVPKRLTISIEPLDHLLIFIPFHLQGSEFVQEEIDVGINKNALHFGRFL